MSIIDKLERRFGRLAIPNLTLAKAMVLAAVSNFLLFFGKEIVRSASDGKRRMAFKARALARPDKPFHCCAICGATERTHPKMDFRYCTKCAGSYEYCADHLHAHEHVALGAASPVPNSQREIVNKDAV